MSSAFPAALRPIRLMFMAFIAVFLSACEMNLGGNGPVVNTKTAVPVALLVPFGSEDPNNDVLATSLQNAAQLAVSDLCIKAHVHAVSMLANPKLTSF